jgi:hypothetical protein
MVLCQSRVQEVTRCPWSQLRCAVIAKKQLTNASPQTLEPSETTYSFFSVVCLQFSLINHPWDNSIRVNLKGFIMSRLHSAVS